MSDFRLPVPIPELKEIIRDKINQGGEFSRTLATIDLMIAMDAGNVKPYRYYAKRWKWKDHTTYKRLKVMRCTVNEWRDFTPKTKGSKREAGGKQEGSNIPTIQPCLSGNGSTKAADRKQEGSSIKHTHTHTHSLNPNELKQPIPDKRGIFKKPTLELLTEYFESYTTAKKINCNFSQEAETFFDFYTSKGWKVGRNPMKDWKAAVRNWLRSAKRENGAVKRSSMRTYDGQNDPQYKQFYT